MKPSDIRDLARRYQAGESLNSIADSLGVCGHTIKDWFRKGGVPLRTRKEAITLAKFISLDVESIVSRYASGETEQAIAKSLNVSRQVIRRRIIEAGVDPRGMSEAQQIRMKSMSREDKKRLTRAANRAVRGSKHTFEHCCKIAASNEANPKTSILEKRLLRRLLHILPGLRHILQKAVGPYNIDIALTRSSVAVEVFGGYWHRGGRHAARYSKRIKYLRDSGWTPVIVWATTQHPISLRAAKYIIALHKKLCSHESSRGKEHVIWGTGKPIPADELDRNTGSPKVRFHGSYRLRGKDGRFRK